MTIDQMNDDDDLIFERGDDEEERSSGYRAQPWWWLKNEGDVSILRFLSESRDWRKVPTHRFFPTKPEPKDHEGNWPKAMSATCRAGILAKRYPEGCAMCTSGYKGEYGKGSKADDVRYTLAVEREEYEDKNGRRAFRDKAVEVPIWDSQTGEVSETETITLPSLVLVGETMFRMMSNLKSNGEAVGSLLTQDFRLKLVKNPSGTKGLIVSSVPLPRDESIVPGSKAWEVYEIAQGLWKPGGLKLDREIMHRAGKEYWEHFFLMEDGRTWKEHDLARNGESSYSKPSGGIPAQSSRPAQAATTEQPSAEKLADLRARITGN